MSTIALILGSFGVLLVVSLVWDAITELRAWRRQFGQQARPQPSSPPLRRPMRTLDASDVVVVEGWRVQRELDRRYLEAARQLRSASRLGSQSRR